MKKKFFLLGFVGIIAAFYYGVRGNGTSHVKGHLVQIGAYTGVYPWKTVREGQVAYVYDFVDNWDLLNKASKELAIRIQKAGLLKDVGYVIVPGDKANALGVLLVERLKRYRPELEFIVFRPKPSSDSDRYASCASVTSDAKKLYMRSDHAGKISGQRVLVVDDVISSGSTIDATIQLIHGAGGYVVALVCCATEGDKEGRKIVKDIEERFGCPLVRLCHLPFKRKESS
jgi:adenine phosphoribosyltransferase